MFLPDLLWKWCPEDVFCIHNLSNSWTEQQLPRICSGLRDMSKVNRFPQFLWLELSFGISSVLWKCVAWSPWPVCLKELLYFEWSPPWHVGWGLSGECYLPCETGIAKLISPATLAATWSSIGACCRLSYHAATCHFAIWKILKRPDSPSRNGLSPMDICRSILNMVWTTWLLPREPREDTVFGQPQ